MSTLMNLLILTLLFLLSFRKKTVFNFITKLSKCKLRIFSGILCSSFYLLDFSIPKGRHSEEKTLEKFNFYFLEIHRNRWIYEGHSWEDSSAFFFLKVILRCCKPKTYGIFSIIECLTAHWCLWSVYPVHIFTVLWMPVPKHYTKNYPYILTFIGAVGLGQ